MSAAVCMCLCVWTFIQLGHRQHLMPSLNIVNLMGLKRDQMFSSVAFLWLLAKAIFPICVHGFHLHITSAPDQPQLLNLNGAYKWSLCRLKISRFMFRSGELCWFLCFPVVSSALNASSNALVTLQTLNLIQFELFYLGSASRQLSLAKPLWSYII